MLISLLITTKGQIIITGAMFDPQGGDAPAVGEIGGDHIHLGGYEYIQLMATVDIDFSVTPYCIVRCINTGASTGAENDGWAASGLARTFKFNLTNGKVNRGEFFYIGGPEKTAGGFLVDGATYYPVLDMSSSKWIRIIAYSNGTTNSVGDDGIGIGNTGLFPNSVSGTAANPIGIAVFSGVNIDKNSLPIDVVFTGYRNPITSWGSVYKDNGGGSINGYKVPNTDRLNVGFYCDSDPNKYAFLFQPSTNVAWFLKLGGVFNTDNNKWTTQRTASYVQLVPPESFGNIALRTSFASLNMIEGNTAGYNGISIESTKLTGILPVALTSFAAKPTKNGTVNLAWTTESEKNNSHFEVLRSLDGKSFAEIARVNGAGNSNTKITYNYNDSKPVSGTNYYQLRQVDFDEKSTLSRVVSATVGLNKNDLKVFVSVEKNTVKVTYDALTAGKASFNIYNTAGVKLIGIEVQVYKGENQIQIPVSLGQAIHILKAQQGNAVATVKF